MISKEEIEIAAKIELGKYEPFDEDSCGYPRPPTYFADQMLYMFQCGVELLRKRAEREKRSAWDAARYQTMNERGEFNWRFERFEDWNVKAADNKTEKPATVQYEIDRLEARKVIYK